jgi:hypothetical protein
MNPRADWRQPRDRKQELHSGALRFARKSGTIAVDRWRRRRFSRVGILSVQSGLAPCLMRNLTPTDAGEAKCSPSVTSFLYRLDCPAVGKRDLNLLFRDPMRAKAADTNAEPGAEAV